MQSLGTFPMLLDEINEIRTVSLIRSIKLKTIFP